MNMHAQSMPSDMYVAALAPLRHVCRNWQDITTIGAKQPSSEFVAAVAQLLQKRKVGVARHLQGRVEAHHMQLRARHAKEWDERHAEHGMSQTGVARSVEQDKMRSIALVAAGRDALCVLMQAAPRQPDGGPKTLQAFVDAHWQFQFAASGGVECVCCAWANVYGIPRVAHPPKASSALVQGTYGQGMRMKTSSQNTWQGEVLESHLGLSRGTTSSRKNLQKLGHHHRLAEESFRQHCAERYHALCPTAATTEVVGRNIVFIQGEAMDIGVPVTHAEAAILSPLVEICIGLQSALSSVP